MKGYWSLPWRSGFKWLISNWNENRLIYGSSKNASIFKDQGMKCIPRPHFEDWKKPFQTWGIRCIALTVTVKEKRGRESYLEENWWLRGKESACSVGATTDLDYIPGLGRCPGGGNSNLFQCSCLENRMDRGVWWATVHEHHRVRHDWRFWASKHACIEIWREILEETDRNGKLLPGGEGDGGEET